MFRLEAVAKKSTSQAQQDARLLTDLHRAQARIYRREQQRIEARIDAHLDEDPKWILSPDLRERLAEISDFISKNSRNAVILAKHLEEAAAAVPTEAIEAQFRAELIRAAAQLSDEDWASMVDARERNRKEAV